MSFLFIVFFMSDVVLGKDGPDDFYEEYPLAPEVYLKIKDRISPKIFPNQEAYDRNSDGQSDLFYNYHSHELISVTKDNNFDGKIDYVLEIKKSGNKESEDTDFNGKFDQWTRYSRQSFSHIKKIISWDLNQDGKIDKKSEFRLNGPGRLLSSYADDLCISTMNMQNEMAIKFTSDLKHQLDKATSGLKTTAYGFSIDRGCYQTFKDDGGPAFVNSSIREAIQEGLSCLANLGFEYLKQETVTSKSEEPGVFENIRRMRSILSNRHQPVYLTCSGNMHKSALAGDAFAIAYQTGEELADSELKDKKQNAKFKSKTAKTPTIELHKDYRQKVLSATGNERAIKQKLKQTIFHELFHNLGYKHSEDIDYMYACDSCCHGKDSYSPEVIALSCKICTGKYQGAKDKNYFNDMLTLSRMHPRFEESHTGQLIINEMKRTNELKIPDPELKFYFAKSLMNVNTLLSCIAMSDAIYSNYYEATISSPAIKKVVINQIPERFLGISQQCDVLLEMHTKPRASSQFIGLFNYLNSYKLYYETAENRAANRVYTNGPHALRNTFMGVADLYREKVLEKKSENKEDPGRLVNIILNRMIEVFPSGENDLEAAALKLTSNAFKALLTFRKDTEIGDIIKTYQTNFEKLMDCKEKRKDASCYESLSSPWPQEQHLKKDSVETFNF